MSRTEQLQRINGEIFYPFYSFTTLAHEGVYSKKISSDNLMADTFFTSRGVATWRHRMATSKIILSTPNTIRTPASDYLSKDHNQKKNKIVYTGQSRACVKFEHQNHLGLGRPRCHLMSRQIALDIEERTIGCFSTVACPNAAIRKFNNEIMWLVIQTLHY